MSTIFGNLMAVMIIAVVAVIVAVLTKNRA